jgi:hypothetical protein
MPNTGPATIRPLTLRVYISAIAAEFHEDQQLSRVRPSGSVPGCTAPV